MPAVKDIAANFYAGYTPDVARPEATTVENPVERALELVAATIHESAELRGRCLLNLSGGSTPLELYRRLARRDDLPWEGVHVYWGDERFVAIDDQRSNAGAAREALLDRVAVPPSQVHPWPILETPAASAAAYAETLLRTAGNPPLFDLTLLGLGTDCHTASLFPGTGAHARAGLTLTSQAPSDGGARLSLTVPALSRSRTVLFLVTGPQKRSALATLLADDGDPQDCPAREISARERLLLLTDQPLTG